MTEEVWQQCHQVETMIRFAQAKVTQRKLRLFLCACCRRLGELLSEEDRQVLMVAEGFAEGQANDDQLSKAHESASSRQGQPATALQTVASKSLTTDKVMWATRSICSAISRRDAIRWEEERRHQANLFRDIVGNLIRPAAIKSQWLEWNDATVERLTRRIDASGEYELLPVLADALEDAGCDDQAILDHCRGQTAHARGCFVIDFILSKDR
jgi:hypothetical protein